MERPIRRVALIGTGLVGASWAVVFARGRCDVMAWDADPGQLERAAALVDSALESLARAQLLDESILSVRRRVRFEPQRATALAQADYVQESVAERLETKREVYAALDREAPPSAILASSTSGFPTSAMADGLESRARCLVVHPVNPPHLIPFVEVSGAPFTAPDVIRRALEFMREVGQSPIHVRREIDGFVLNRLQWSLLGEALRLIEEGIATPEDIDRAIRDGLGRRWAFMGPMEVGDLNAPGGIADYLTRFGPTIDRIATSRGAAPLPLTREHLESIATAQTAASRGGTREERVARRDAWLLALAKLCRDAG